MKALAWNILAFILGYVPNLLQRQKLNEKIIKHDRVLKILEMQMGLFR